MLISFNTLQEFCSDDLLYFCCYELNFARTEMKNGLLKTSDEKLFDNYDINDILNKYLSLLINTQGSFFDYCLSIIEKEYQNKDEYNDEYVINLILDKIKETKNKKFMLGKNDQKYSYGSSKKRKRQEKRQVEDVILENVSNIKIIKRDKSNVINYSLQDYGNLYYEKKSPVLLKKDNSIEL